MATTTYLAAYNVPGYSPTTEPVPFTDVREAWDYLRDEHELALDQAEDDSQESYWRGRFASMWNHEVPGTFTLPTPGYTGSHDLGVAYTVEEVSGVVCADCGTRFIDTRDAQQHWDDEHDR